MRSITFIFRNIILLVLKKIAGEYSEDLATQMLATTLGVEFDSETDWNE
jgi:arginine decarboxylase